MRTLRERFRFQEESPHLYWLYNINQEQEWNDCQVFPSIQDNSQSELMLQQEQQMLFLAGPEDTLLFRHEPDEHFLAYLEGQGVVIPPIQYMADGTSLPWKEMQQSPHSLLVPYIPNEWIHHEASLYHIPVYGSEPVLAKRINDKFWTRRFAERLGFTVTQGFFCTSEEQLRQAYQELHRQGFEKTVVKVPFGSSGKGLRIIKDERSFHQLLHYIKRRRTPFELLLEGWHPISRSLNAQLLIDSGGATLLGVTEQTIDSYGVYKGTDYTPRYDPVVYQRYQESMLHLGRSLAELGYSGIAGVDSILDEQGVLIPVIEINARFTQVTYLLPLIDRLRLTNRYVVSRFVRLESRLAYSFEDVKASLMSRAGGGAFLIYNFARSTTATKTIYRVFFLVYGDDWDTVRQTVDALEPFSFQ